MFIKICSECQKSISGETQDDCDNQFTAKGHCKQCGLKHLSQSVARACNNPELRKRLDNKKKRSLEEIQQAIKSSESVWTLVSGIENYCRQDTKNLTFVCNQGHEMIMSLIQVMQNSRCKVCNPKKHAGKLNPAFVTLSEFNTRLLEKRGEDSFRFDPTEYSGVYTAITFQCTKCGHLSKKQPRAILQEKIGCAGCTNQVPYTTETFIAKAKEIWKDAFDFSLVQYGQHNKNHITLVCKKGHTFSIAPSNLLSGRGCRDCAMKKFVSAAETEWLNSLNLPIECRNRTIKIKNRQFNVDALINGTIYEYYGDFWHGNPKRFTAENTHPCQWINLTMGELYARTIEREAALRSAGYVVITMWESDWMQLRKTRSVVS